MNTMLIKFLLFFYLTSTYLGATHIHYKALESVDCKVHVLVKNLNSADTPVVNEILFICEKCYNTLFYQGNDWIIRTFKGFHSQAPPFFS